MRRVNLDPNAPYVGNRPPLLSRSERNRRALNGIPPDAPRPLIRKESERRPLIDLAEQDRLAELERSRKAQLAEKERSLAEHQAKLESSASAPKPAKAKRRKRNG